MGAKQTRRTPAGIAPQKSTSFDPSEHSALMQAILDGFATHFAPGSALVFARDPHGKPGHFDAARLSQLGINLDMYKLMPNVVLIDVSHNRLFMVEAITENGLMTAGRRKQLAQLFANASQCLIYITAFPNRALMVPFMMDIAWETEVWVADAPSHLIHFNGSRFLGPYAKA